MFLRLCKDNPFHRLIKEKKNFFQYVFLRLFINLPYKKLLLHLQWNLLMHKNIKQILWKKYITIPKSTI